MSIEKSFCPCCSGEEYDKCCKSFHEGVLPKSALQLMRSRFSAYVLNIPDYIIATTHPANPGYSENKFSWRRSISRFSQDSSFQKLEILDFKEKASIATVIFTAYLSQDGHDATFTEKSYFEKVHHRWLYRGGQLVSGHTPNLITTGQLRLLPLAYYGDPILRKKADLIVHITEEVKKLVEEMIETMDASDGVGLAAPQVHHSIRLFVIRTPIENEAGKFDLGDVKVFINPKLSLPSKETWVASEGCLSIPGIRSSVERPKEITVEYTSLEGAIVQERVFGWEARVVMHENDHINGVFFIDRLSSKERMELAPVLQSLEKRIHDNLAL
ncbi:MAG: peptide deformylase [Chlamydiota bacterium]